MGAVGTAAAQTAVRVTGPTTLQLVDQNGQPLASWTVEATILDVVQSADTLYVACGPAGVLIYDLSAPQQNAPIGRIAVGSNIVKLALNGQSLLAMTANYTAITYSLSNPHKPQLAGQPPPWVGVGPARDQSPVWTPAGQPAPMRPSRYFRTLPRAPVSAWARVTAVRHGRVEVMVPAGERVQPGDHFIVRSQRRALISAPGAEKKLYGPSNEDLGMFAVTEVNGNVASGSLPRGTVARLGDLAEPTQAPLSTPLVAPRLWYGMGRFYSTLRPIVQVAGTAGGSSAGLGFAMLNDFTLEYYFRVPLKLGVQLAPLGFLTGPRPGVTTEMRALVSFATSYFELGLSPGVELHLTASTRFLMGAMMRIGSLDGLNLIVQGSAALDDSDRSGSQVVFGSLATEVNIPLAQRFTLFFNGAGAQYWGYGDAGLKYYVRGGGGPGSLIMHAAFGGAYVADRCTVDPNSTRAGVCQNNSAEGLGPMLAVGVDARF